MKNGKPKSRRKQNKGNQERKGTQLNFKDCKF